MMIIQITWNQHSSAMDSTLTVLKPLNASKKQTKHFQREHNSITCNYAGNTILFYTQYNTSFECIHIYTHISYFQKRPISHKYIYKRIPFHKIHDTIKLKLESRGNNYDQNR